MWDMEQEARDQSPVYSSEISEPCFDFLYHFHFTEVLPKNMVIFFVF